ncbi:hypothetical protein [Burkholderia gladioli]|uniref:hypothetical protein n=1 Tax=Burkholderia gladioli TaxID=28095 RepID=UPI00163FA2CE|nr:hypothetical protein [Burkholderia gladioli]
MKKSSIDYISATFIVAWTLSLTSSNSTTEKGCTFDTCDTLFKIAFLSTPLTIAALVWLAFAFARRFPAQAMKLGKLNHSWKFNFFIYFTAILVLLLKFMK